MKDKKRPDKEGGSANWRRTCKWGKGSEEAGTVPDTGEYRYSLLGSAAGGLGVRVDASGASMQGASCTDPGQSFNRSHLPADWLIGRRITARCARLKSKAKRVTVRT